MSAQRGRPAGAFGAVRQALVQAWASGPAPVREAAERAQVGRSVARYTASRMIDDGQLVVLHPGWPPVLALAAEAPVDSDTQVRTALDALGAAFWGHRA